MSKYGKYTGGQIEAVLNKIGGERAVDGILQGTLEVTTKEVSRTPTMVECGVFSSCRCTICGAYFGDGDNVCANGHVIGETYEKN